jgi:hypothetical protein
MPGTFASPFASSSLWNTTIDPSNTFYSDPDSIQDQQLRDPSLANSWASFENIEFVTPANAPLVTWTYSALNQTPEGGTFSTNGTIQLPTPTNIAFGNGSDGWAIFSDPDGVHYWEVWEGSYNSTTMTYQAAYMVEGNYVTGTGWGQNGIGAGIRASGASLLGGIVTQAELNNLSIPHALAIELAPAQLEAGTTPSGQFVYPAVSADTGSVGTYSGTIPMGAHFALPANLDLADAGLTPEGLALAEAYQTYGGYVVDSATSTDSFAQIEGGTTQQFNDIFADLNWIRDHLVMVSTQNADEAVSAIPPEAASAIPPAQPQSQNAQLQAQFSASSQDQYQSQGLTAAYVYTGFGVPTLQGYQTLIGNNDATDFGAGAGGAIFNQENVYINSFVNLITGNPTAASNFTTILGGATTLSAALTAVYNSMVPAADQTATGLLFLLSEADFFTARAAQVGLTTIEGVAAVAAASLANILVNNNIPGLGQEIDQFTAAVANGSAEVPATGGFTPILNAIGTGGTVATGGTIDVTNMSGQTLDAAAMTNDTGGISGVLIDSLYQGNTPPTELTATVLHLNSAATLTDDAAGTIASSITLTHLTGTANTLAITINDTSTTTADIIDLVKSIGDATVSISSGGLNPLVANAIDNYSETDNNLTGITISGTNPFDLTAVHTDTSATLTGNTQSSLTSINASGNSGGVTITAGATDTISGFSLTYTGLTITGSSAIDFIENDAASGVITLGNGGTALTSSHFTSATVTNNAETVNFGTGFDDATVNQGSLSLAFTGGSTAQSVTLTGAVSAHDLVNLTAFAPAAGTPSDYTSNTLVTAAPSLAAAEGNIAHTIGNDSVGYFTFGGNEYIVATGGTASSSGASVNNYSVTGHDVVITLTGGNLHHITDTAGVLTLLA